MLAWILEDAGLAPGFLIGGVPAQFPVSARLGGAPFFVIEADEYDTAFFDKRAKFVHYRPRTAILNNLEYDHADIYPDVGVDPAPVPSSGAHRAGLGPHHRATPRDAKLARDAGDGLLDAASRAFARVGGARRPRLHCGARSVRGRRRLVSNSTCSRRQPCGTVRWPLIGAHNVENALAAIAAARHAGVPVAQALRRPRAFQRRAAAHGTARRGRRASAVYDDFAHHPTAIATTLDGLRRRVGDGAHRRRARAALEHHADWACIATRSRRRCAAADAVWLFAPPDLGWDIAACCSRSSGDARARRARRGCADRGAGARRCAPATRCSS